MRRGESGPMVMCSRRRGCILGGRSAGTSGYHLKSWGFRPARAWIERVERVLDLVELKGFGKKFPWQLVGGDAAAGLASRGLWPLMPISF